jgi:hypothetical protein
MHPRSRFRDDWLGEKLASLSRHSARATPNFMIDPELELRCWTMPARASLR